MQLLLCIYNFNAVTIRCWRRCWWCCCDDDDVVAVEVVIVLYMNVCCLSNVDIVITGVSCVVVNDNVTDVFHYISFTVAVLFVMLLLLLLLLYVHLLLCFIYVVVVRYDVVV